MKFGLSDNALTLIRGVFEQHPEVARVVVYGSRALGCERPNSDIDLALAGDLDDVQIGRIAAELDELPLPYLFDVLAQERITHQGLKAHIDQFGQDL